VTCWNITAAAVVCLAGVELPVATAQPAPRPPGWPSTFCVAEGLNKLNPICGTCSRAILYPMPEVGTAVQWKCKGENGQWMAHGFVIPWMADIRQPPATDYITKGPWAAFWDANATVTTPSEEAKYSTLIEAAKPYLARALVPPEPTPPAPSAWIVAPLSTGQRPSYTLNGTEPIREAGKFIPTVTAGQPTACTCEGDGNSFTLTGSRYCVAQGMTTATGGKRFAACVLKPK